MFSAEPSRLGSWNAKREQEGFRKSSQKIEAQFTGFSSNQKVKCPSALTLGGAGDEHQSLYWGEDLQELVFGGD